MFYVLLQPLGQFFVVGVVVVVVTSSSGVMQLRSACNLIDSLAIYKTPLNDADSPCLQEQY